jgi:hypothetical protein
MNIFTNNNYLIESKSKFKELLLILKAHFVTFLSAFFVVKMFT